MGRATAIHYRDKAARVSLCGKCSTLARMRRTRAATTCKACLAVLDARQQPTGRPTKAKGGAGGDDELVVLSKHALELYDRLGPLPLDPLEAHAWCQQALRVCVYLETKNLAPPNHSKEMSRLARALQSGLPRERLALAEQRVLEGVRVDAEETKLDAATEHSGRVVANTQRRH